MPFQPVLIVQEDATEKPKKQRKPRKTKEQKEYTPGPGPFGLVKGAKVERIISDEREALYWLNKETGWIGLDLETSGLNPWKDAMLVMGLYGPENQTAAVLHVKATISGELKRFIESGRKFVTHNGLNFDIPYCSTHGVDVSRAEWFDTLIGEQVVTGTDRRGIPKNLQAVVKRRLGVDISKDVDHRDWLAPELTERQIRYVAEDISFLPAIMEAQWEKADETDAKWGVHPIYGTGVRDALAFEMELLPVTLAMELNGLPVNAPDLFTYEAIQAAKSQEALAYLDATFGAGVNWGSWQQIIKAFKYRFDIALPSTQEDTLIEVRDLTTGSEISTAITHLLEYRGASKRASMYGAEFIDKYVTDGRVHSMFRQCGTDTGRYSSVSPNFQQLPGDARYWIGGDPELTIIAPDYSQIEVRIAANEAEDWELIQAFGGEDVHTMIASQVFGIPPEAVTKTQRKLSKAMSFTLLFGGGAARLAHYATQQGANLPLTEAKPLVIAFFDRFQGLAKMRRHAYAVAASGRPVPIRFPTGLRRVLTPGVDLTATRLLNNVVQGAAAAGLKYGLIEARNAGLVPYLGAVVHDEAVAAVSNALAKDYGNELAKAMVKGMERVCENAPVKVEVKEGRTWS